MTQRRLGRLADREPAGSSSSTPACAGRRRSLLQNNPLTGLLILVGIAWGAFDIGHPTDPRRCGRRSGRRHRHRARCCGRTGPRCAQGLFGFSPLLTGIGVPTFLDDRPLMWLYLVLGAAATTVVTLALNAVFNTWGLTAFTFPFVLTTWFLLLGAYQFDRFTVLTDADQPALPGEGPLTGGGLRLATSCSRPSCEGVSQVFLIDSWVSRADHPGRAARQLPVVGALRRRRRRRRDPARALVRRRRGLAGQGPVRLQRGADRDRAWARCCTGPARW